ncbi:uncharacterized protein LOC110036690, partial [Phalaenopsis equestris]|uniref:uncharacterized protein LOC110036690 n=1 Tax=Phalaenopsis equestris TaxID=78828 RepID=UPI0009E1B46E
MKLLEQIPDVNFYRIPRGDNGHADTLAKIAKEMTCPLEDFIEIIVQGRQVLSQINLETLHKLEKEETINTVTDINQDWRKPLIEYLYTGKLPEDKSEANHITRRAMSYALMGNVLYR